ncbi:MAG TPA: hypothetical protein VG651_03755 [Stellaceae bacterium]|nr:hypothetical protein [Stellaceae bacterium]
MDETDRNSTTPAMTEAERRAAGWLRAWDGQGIHRTGTEGDSAGATWLADEARALGAPVTVEEFAFERLDPGIAYLEIGGERIDAVPVFDAPATDADGVSGALGAGIAVVELSPRAVYSGAFQRLRRRAGHCGLVVVCQGDAPGLGLINAEDFRRPYGAPAVHVSSEVRDPVLAAARDGAPARLVAHSCRIPARGANVVVALRGTDPAKPPLVVMTPRSSWWQSTAERGGGLVCWLESLRALLAAPPARDVVFTANTGHELGHLGLDDFIARRPGWDQGGATGAAKGVDWLHYGANLGARGGWLSLVANAEDLRRRGLAALTEAGQPPDDIPWPVQPPSGETRDIHKAGGRYLTLVATNPLFHLPQDRWPHAVDVSAVARIADAAARMTFRLSR